MASLTSRQISAVPSLAWWLIALAESIISSPSRFCLCVRNAHVLTGKCVLHHRLRQGNALCHIKAVFSFIPPSDQWSQMQSPALMCSVSRRGIKYLEWEAPALTKNTSMQAGLTGSTNVWQPSKPALGWDATANQRVFPESKIQGKVPTFVSCWGAEFKFLNRSVLGERREAAFFSHLLSVCD